MSLLLLLVGAKTSGAGITAIRPVAYDRFRREDQEILDLIMIIVESEMLE